MVWLVKFLHYLSPPFSPLSHFPLLLLSLLSPPSLPSLSLPPPSPLPLSPQVISKRRINKLEQTLLHWRTRLRSKQQKDTVAQRPVTLRRRRQQVKSEDNWPLFYYQFNEDHATSTLIWNYKVHSRGNHVHAMSLDVVQSVPSDLMYGGTSYGLFSPFRHEKNFVKLLKMKFAHSRSTKTYLATLSSRGTTWSLR